MPMVAGANVPPEFVVGATPQNPPPNTGNDLSIAGTRIPQPPQPPIQDGSIGGARGTLPTLGSDNRTPIAGSLQPQNLQPAQPVHPSSAWTLPPNSGIDLSMFVPGPQNIPNGNGGHWPVEFQPVNYNPFSSAGTVAQPGVQPGGPVNNNLTMR